MKLNEIELIFNHGGFRECRIVEDEFQDKRFFKLVFISAIGGGVFLEAQRAGSPRQFVTVESAVNVLRKIGCTDFNVRLMPCID